MAITFNIESIGNEMYKLTIEGGGASYTVQLFEQDLKKLLKSLRAEVKAAKLEDSHLEYLVVEHKAKPKSEREIVSSIIAQSVSNTEASFFTPNSIDPGFANEAFQSCVEFMEALGFQVVKIEDPEYGSFFRKLFLAFKKEVTPEEAMRVYQKGLRALELKYLDVPTADQTEKLSIAARNLVSAMETQEEGVARLGAIMVVKRTIDGKPRLVIMQLSSEEIIAIEKDPSICRSVDGLSQLISGQLRSKNLKN